MPSPLAWLGWIGMVVLLWAYFLRLRLRPRTYAGLNLLAAAMIAPICYAQEAWPPFVLQIAWAAIAVRDLVVRSEHDDR